MTSLPLPLICITCLPPWPQAMMHAGKNIENRDATVAARLAPFVGQNIGISQSKGYPSYHTKYDAEDQVREVEFMLRHDEGFNHGDLGRAKDWEATAGKLVIVARLDRIAHPHDSWKNRWHVAGQHGLVLGKVWQVEPLPCRGAVGAWSPRWCGICQSISAPNANMKCTVCKTGALYNADGERPQLRPAPASQRVIK